MTRSRGACGLPKTARLRRRAEFLQVQNGGRRRHGADLVVLTLPRDAAETRLGVTVSGRVGGAVVRNRIKRVVRETFRRTRTGLPGGLDLVVIAKPSAAARSSRQLAAGVAEILPHA